MPYLYKYQIGYKLNIIYNLFSYHVESCNSVSLSIKWDVNRVNLGESTEKFVLENMNVYKLICNSTSRLKNNLRTTPLEVLEFYIEYFVIIQNFKKFTPILSFCVVNLNYKNK